MASPKQQSTSCVDMATTLRLHGTRRVLFRDVLIAVNDKNVVRPLPTESCILYKYFHNTFKPLINKKKKILCLIAPLTI